MGTANRATIEGLEFDVAAACDVQAAVECVRAAWGVHATYHSPQVLPSHSDAPYVKSTYPAKWLTRYLLKGYAGVDPVVKRGVQSVLPFDWSELTPDGDALDLMVDALDHGLGPCGYTVPVIDPAGRPSLFSLNGDLAPEEWAVFIDENRGLVTRIAHLVHGKAVQEQHGEDAPLSLAPRQKEVLLWAAKGRTAKEIARMLGLSPHTVRTYLQATQSKLGAGNLGHAVAIAIRQRLIEDV